MTSRFMRKTPNFAFDIIIPPRQIYLQDSINQVTNFTANKIYTHPNGGSLWLGNYDDSIYAQNYNIQYIINLAKECNTPDLFKQDKKTYKHYYLEDNSNEKDNMDILLQQIIHEINEIISQNNNVLVHCRLGYSRSATVVIAYIMNYVTHHDYDTAFTLVKEKRNKICPNIGFCFSLRELENKKNNNNSFYLE